MLLRNLETNPKYSNTQTHCFHSIQFYAVKVGPTFNESEEDELRASQINQRTVTEVTPDGRIIEKKIVTYPGEEITEIEEVEEVDGQTMSIKRTVIGSENKEVQPKPKSLAEIKKEPTVLVPGFKTVEFDEKTNSTIVTEKTTTGHQQTITTVQEDGTKKIQIKTFYDPVEVSGDEEEEETYEEIEEVEPGTMKTIVKTVTASKDGVKVGEQKTDSTTESKSLTELKKQPVVIVPGHQKVEFDQETNTTTVTDKTTTGHQQTITTVNADGRSVVQTKVKKIL